MNKYVKKGLCLVLATGLIASSFAGCAKVNYVTEGAIKAIHQIKDGSWKKQAEGEEAGSSEDTSVLEKSFDLTAAANEISLDLAPGTYTATITSEFAITRTVSFVVGDADIAGPAIAMVVCDYNKDKGISATDATLVYKEVTASQKNLAFDLNGDGGISGTDATTVYAIASSAISLPAVTIK